MDIGAELNKRLGQMRAHEAVGAGDDHRAIRVQVAKVGREPLELVLGPS